MWLGRVCQTESLADISQLNLHTTLDRYKLSNTIFPKVTMRIKSNLSNYPDFFLLKFRVEIHTIDRQYRSAIKREKIQHSENNNNKNS